MQTLLSTREEQDLQPVAISSTDWQDMEDAFIDAEEFQQLEFGDFELRFVPMQDQTYSLLLSKSGIDVFHFMWTEVEGLVNITHRIVNPEYRGQGIGSKVMQMIVDRLQRQADAQQQSIHLMMETNQLSVVGLGLRSDMQLTQGQEVYAELMKKTCTFHMDPVSTVVSDANDYAQFFRLSRAVKPQRPLQWRVREDVTRVLAT